MQNKLNLSRSEFLKGQQSSSWRSKFARANWSSVSLDPSYQLQLSAGTEELRGSLLQNLSRIFPDWQLLPSFEENTYLWLSTSETSLAMTLHSEFGFQMKLESERTGLSTLRIRAQDLRDQLLG